MSIKTNESYLIHIFHFLFLFYPHRLLPHSLNSEVSPDGVPAEAVPNFMENLTHSFSKKSYSGNGFGMASHKSVYDDVFGGPPKFGVPTLAPRFEDYTEIFGGFHSSRGCSIPILDLPLVEDVELSFDVRSSRLDYSEVFGGFDGLNFAVSFEDLVTKSNGRDDSSDDAWSPAQSETLSDETDPSACSERSHSLLNADADNLFTDVRQFNDSYHKFNQKSSGKISNSSADIAQVHEIPGHAYLINEDPASPTIEEEGLPLQARGDFKSNAPFVGKTVEERCFKKSISFPTNSNFREPGSGPHLAGSSGSAFTQKKPFVTVNDISLRTRPSRLPPPSRPPPAFSVEKGEPDRSNSKLRASNSYAFERMARESSPPFYDVEIDASSSKAASVAVKVTVENAQAKVGSTKEPMEKEEVPQSHLKLQAQDSIKTLEEKVNKTFNGDNSCKNDNLLGLFAKGGNGMQPIVHERQNVIKMSQEASDSLDGEKYIDLVEKPTNRRLCKESSQVSHKPEGTFAWRQETEYFEVVETDISLEAVEHDKNGESNVLQNKGSVDCAHGIKSATGASMEQQVIREVKASKEAPKMDKKKNQLEMRKDAFEWSDNRERPNRPMESSCQNESHKNVKADVTTYESEMNKKTVRKSKQYLRKGADKNVEKLETVDCNAPEVELKGNPIGSSEGTDAYEVTIDVHATKADERRYRDCSATEEYNRNLEETVEQGEDVKLQMQHEERRKQEESSEKEENNKKQNGLCEGEKNGSIGTEATKQEDNKKGLNVAIEQDESQNNFTPQQEDKKGYKEPDCETEEKKEMVFETHKLVEHEKQYEVAQETAELDASLSEVWMQEPVASGSAVAFEDDDTGENSTSTSTLKGSTDVSQYAVNHEELPEQTDDADKIKWDEDDDMVNFDPVIHNPTEGENISSADGACQVNNQMHETPETIQATTLCEQDVAMRSSKLHAEEISVSFGKNQNDSQHEKDKIRVEDDTKLPYMCELFKDSNRDGIGIGNTADKQDKKVAQMASDSEKMRPNTHEKGQSGKVTDVAQMNFSEETTENSTMHQVFRERTENGKKIGAASAVLDDKKNILNTHQRITSQNAEPKQRHIHVALAPDIKKIEERLHQERELENEHLRKLEEEREREREREKDRMAVDRAALEARERSYAEARERAERTAIGRSTAEVRQRAPAETRGNVEARVRAERAAVERATAEARQRAFEKAMADKASLEGRERVERPVLSDKFYASSRNAEMRQSSSSSGLPDLHSQSTGTSTVLRYAYSSTYAGSESESPQRSKARLERYRRTAERAAKALAEKNMRDLLAQREQAERSRLAETLDAEVRRWSSGKEGNLRALLSTLQYILGPDSGWQPVPLTEVITSAAVKKAYRKATLCVHPDKLQQRGASIQQKYICEKVFDLLKEAWNTFNSEER